MPAASGIAQTEVASPQACCAAQIHTRRRPGAPGEPRPESPSSGRSTTARTFLSAFRAHNALCRGQNVNAVTSVDRTNRSSLAPIEAFGARQDFENRVGRTGFEPVTSSVSEKSRTVPGVCHRRTESNGEPLTWAKILATSCRVWRPLVALAPISGSRRVAETSGTHCRARHRAMSAV
jgi:hypothetical protein